jgi:hypothetical protein
LVTEPDDGAGFNRGVGSEGGVSAQVRRAPKPLWLLKEESTPMYDEFIRTVEPDLLLPALKERYGERYGGYWLDTTPPDTALRIGIVSPGDDDYAFLSALRPGQTHRVTLVPVKHSEGELQKYKKELAAELCRVTVETNEAAFSYAESMIRYDHNQVQVTTNAEDARIFAMLRDLVPNEALDIQVAPRVRIQHRVVGGGPRRPAAS